MSGGPPAPKPKSGKSLNPPAAPSSLNAPAVKKASATASITLLPPAAATPAAAAAASLPLVLLPGAGGGGGGVDVAVAEADMAHVTSAVAASKLGVPEQLSTAIAAYEGVVRARWARVVSVEGGGWAEVCHSKECTFYCFPYCHHHQRAHHYYC